MDKVYFAFAFFGVTALAACSSAKTVELTEQPVESPVIAASPPNKASPTNLPAITEPLELTLRDALALTLERNPELQSFSQTIRTGEARVIQAGVIPNPEVSLEIEDAFGPDGNDSFSQATLQLSQVIELGGKRTARVKAATVYKDQLKDDYEIKRVEVLSNATEKFIRLVTDKHLLELAQKGQSLAQGSLQNIQQRSQAGGISELEEAKAKVLLARYQLAREHAEHELLASKRAIAAFWGEDAPKFSGIRSDIFQTPSLPTFEELSARIEDSPEIRRWATERRLREAESKLADSKAYPNLLISAGPRRLEQTNDNAWVFQFSVPLPIFDRNQGARTEAEILGSKVGLDTKATRLRLKNTLFALYQEAKHAETQLEMMKSEIIPEAERALTNAQAGYDQGRFTYLDLVDAQRTLIDVLRENIEAAYTFHSLVNSVERLLGAPIHTKSKTN